MELDTQLQLTLCRAKRKDNNQWIEGYYACQSNHACFQNAIRYKHYIFRNETVDINLGGLAEYEVKPETVFRFTGKIHKYERVYEGDILSTWHHNTDNYGNTTSTLCFFTVLWDNDSYRWVVKSSVGWLMPLSDVDWGNTLIAGNIIDDHIMLDNIVEVKD